MISLNSAWFTARWREAKNRAGKRYEPDLNLDLPITEYFDAVTQNRAFFAKLSELEARLQDAKFGLHLGSTTLQGDQVASFEASLGDLSSRIAEIAQFRELPAVLPLDQIVKLAEVTRGMAETLVSALPENPDIRPQIPPVADRQREVLRDIEYAIENTRYSLSSPVVSVSNDPYLLLLGSAGTGKTHLLCEVTRKRIEEGLPALLFLGQAFRSPFDNALEALVHSIDPTLDPEEFLAALDEYAIAHSTRCLISIDAINEGHRDSWLRSLPDLVATLRRYRGLAVVIGCRTPFDKLLVPSPQDLHLQVIQHFGFPPEQQSDAIEKYFRAYGIPLPEVPLLEEEFSNPLFLKLFCEAIENATVKLKHAQIRDIASGQKGMTYILEHFVRQKGKIIANRLPVPASLAWVFLKEHLAPPLAAQHTDTISLADAKALADALQPAGMSTGAFLQALIDEDVLAEDVAFDQSGPQEVVRFTYQKFADHLIARHLLAAQLDASSAKTIKRSLQDPTALGSYFQSHEAALENINIVQALMIEFPTRIKNKGELLDFLDWDGLPVRLCEAFLEGLYWRDPRSINRSTGRWVSAFLKEENIRHDTLNVLLALSVKPRHPFHAGRLDTFLESWQLAQRDLFWSEYLRRNLNRGTPIRILVWAEHVAPRVPSAEFANAYIKVLKWFLTSTQRGFRDRTTHALFRLGQAHPEILFQETLGALSLNDPYVPERMLAASYGTAMALWHKVPTGEFQKKILPNFARGLCRNMFARKARYGTTHILSRDYAQRTIQLALFVKPRVLSAKEQQLLNPPFRFGGIRRWGEKQDRDEGRYREGDAPLGMDFANYTLGRLVRNRSPYDDNAGDYPRVKRQILWRIYDLGYSLDLFSAADREIARYSWHAEQRGRESGKTDRYGKKYAWIAFYELAGYRVDKGLMDLEERISDADIDPSFPEKPQFPGIFNQAWIDHKGSVREWLFSGYKPLVEDRLVLPSVGDYVGPWIMLRGHVNRESADKTIFSFFDGLLVRTDQVSAVIRALSGIGYPGNHHVPRPEAEYYTYAGEIPWANTWRPEQYPHTMQIDGEEVRVILPVRDYSWESYHSIENQLGGVSFVSRELGEDLNLCVQIPSITMAQRGIARPATIPIESGDSPYRDYESLLFIRQDLLDGYLSRKGLSLVLYVWGERRANYRNRDDARESEGRFEIADVLHKQGFLYQMGRFERFL